LRIAMGVGNLDTNIMNNLIEVERILTSYQVPHTLQIYPGTHTSGIPVQLETKVLPYFAEALEAAHNGR
jgi:S-formylglutathione hydrolase